MECLICGNPSFLPTCHRCKPAAVAYRAGETKFDEPQTCEECGKSLPYFCITPICDSCLLKPAPGAEP